MKHIAFIGAGNMAYCLIRGLLNNNYSAQHIWATAPSAERLQELAEELKINVTQNNIMAAQQADIILLAVKPQILRTVINELADNIQPQQLIISVAAGIRAKQIQQWINKEIAVIRNMPNTPALIGAGMSALYANEYAQQEHKQLAEIIAQAVGKFLWVDDEEQMDIVSALSGSGPAYFFLFMEALQQAASKLGLAPDIAEFLVKETAVGSAKMALVNKQNFVELRQLVTSPGGGTEQAIKALENADIRDMILKALQAAQKRYQELALNYG